MSSKDGGPPRKRESRSGTRKVSNLSAEQLERKRANDREAQRTIRQRTKEHLQHLEHRVSALQAQVEEMRPRSEQFDQLVQQNAALQEEVNRLKQQLGYPIDRPGFPRNIEQTGPFQSEWQQDEGTSNISNPMSNTMLSPFSGSSHPPNVPRAPSAVSVSSRSSHPPDWQLYPDTRPTSVGEISEPEYSTQPYVMDRQLRQSSHLVPPRRPGAPQLSFGRAAGQSQQHSESSFPQVRRGHPARPFLPSQGSANTAQPAPGLPYPSQYQNHMVQQPQRDPTYPYPWNPQS
ncbi:hypothetical protein PENDEC_c001G01069 [Penicillium decumbens]|uniref:BZIP domain-containing protein n=1 Tax=Penicillium decumbens TaxID=69771 RepID=A0A1V6PNC4_PENDC|nr:hypothetical protein PENDEC_c001G01069 [Penicillium decumbens]